MNFTGGIFIFYFLPITLLVYHLAKRYSVTVALAILSIASLIFYAWEVPSYIFLISFSVLIDWFATVLMLKTESKPKRLMLLLISLFSNLGLLAFFKYSGFIARNLGHLSGFIGFDILTPAQSNFFTSIVLPVGISFYTLQTLSYVIDVYDGTAIRARNFVEFICFVTSFPQLVAGPIVRYSDIYSQLKKPIVTCQNVQAGIIFFVLGLAKKILIADSMEPLASFIFDHALVTGGILNLLGLIAYGLQIYFDFSAYSEMAIGLGLFLGFTFPQNFNRPYKSASITEFWRRWHMTLSAWVRDYLYIKMGGNRKGKIRTDINLMLSMAICGLWHGAGWSFLFWGTGHGLALVVDKLFSKAKDSFFMRFVRKYWGLFVVFSLWIPFRAKGISEALRIFHNITFNFFQLNMVKEFSLLPSGAKWTIIGLLPVILFVVFEKDTYDLKRRLTPLVSVAVIILFIMVTYVMLSRDYIPFIYFQF